MKESSQHQRWSVVVADDHGPEWAPPAGSRERPAPAQYCRLGGSATLLQRALQRAGRMAPSSQIMVTAMDAWRSHWEHALWFVRPEHRFIGDSRAASPLTMAAALLSIAARSPQSVVTVMPARCHVRHEWMLALALEQALASLPQSTEGVVTLGMRDLDDGLDEDYLLAGLPQRGAGLVAQAVVRRPATWVAVQLRERGAMVSSGILVGYAGIFADHIEKYCPDLAAELRRRVSAAAECRVPIRLCSGLQRGIRTSALHPLKFSPPFLPQRVVCVDRSGWSSLQSARSVARISNFVSTQIAVAAPDRATRASTAPGSTLRHRTRDALRTWLSQSVRS
jgi:hypothetical protein